MQNTAAKLSWFTRLLQRTSVLNSVNYNHINDTVAYKFIYIYTVNQFIITGEL